MGGTLGGYLLLVIWSGFRFHVAHFGQPGGMILAAAQAVAGVGIAISIAQRFKKSSAFVWMGIVLCSYGALGALNDVFLIREHDLAANWWSVSANAAFALIWITAVVYKYFDGKLNLKRTT
jgi:hypothetical protein